MLGEVLLFFSCLFTIIFKDQDSLWNYLQREVGGTNGKYDILATKSFWQLFSAQEIPFKSLYVNVFIFLLSLLVPYILSSLLFACLWLV